MPTIRSEGISGRDGLFSPFSAALITTSSDFSSGNQCPERRCTLRTLGDATSAACPDSLEGHSAKKLATGKDGFERFSVKVGAFVEKHQANNLCRCYGRRSFVSTGKSTSVNGRREMATFVQSSTVWPDPLMKANIAVERREADYGRRLGSVESESETTFKTSRATRTSSTFTPTGANRPKPCRVFKVLLQIGARRRSPRYTDRLVYLHSTMDFAVHGD